LHSRRKGDPHKVEIAARLRRDTVMTLKWIAQALQMGSWRVVEGISVGPDESAADYVNDR
jgi:hypothetical protein